MQEAEALEKLIPPSQKRTWKPNRGGIIQVIVTTSCDKQCANCTQLANIKRPHWEMFPEHFETICQSLEGYFGVVALFGGNPCLSQHFEDYCEILTQYFPKEQRGLWTNKLFGHGALARETFGAFNLNTHGDQEAYDEMRRDWPEAQPMHADQDSRHAPVFVSMLDLDRLPQPDGTTVDNTEENRWDLIANCDLNYHWSGAATVINGQPLGYFCEIAAAQSLYRKDSSTGIPITPGWWKAPMQDYAHQARYHCHRCSVPLKGYGELSTKQDGLNQISAEYADGFRVKGKQEVDIVYAVDQLRAFGVDKVTNYRKNV